MRIILPFRLPTWNQLLAMNFWERKRIRDWIKNSVSTCITEQIGSQTQTDAALKQSLTPLSLREYYQMIVPNSSRKLRNRKRLLRGMKKRSLR